VQVFGSLEDSMMQLFTIMFGDVQFSTLKTIMNVNTVSTWLHMLQLYTIHISMQAASFSHSQECKCLTHLV
jgi:hypothetical protein